MKSLHAHAAVVEDLAKSIGFYSTLFGAQPIVLKDDYAKSTPDDPRVNFAFAISDRTAAAGVDRLGSGKDLAELSRRLEAAGEATRDQEAATCCYTRSDKVETLAPAQACC